MTSGIFVIELSWWTKPSLELFFLLVTGGWWLQTVFNGNQISLLDT